MTSRERVKRCLNFQRPDRIGIYDVFSEDTVKKWREQGLPPGKDAPGYFEHDFQSVSLDDPVLKGIDAAKFICISVTEPFQQAAQRLGLEELLKDMACDPKAAQRLFHKTAEEILKKASSLMEKHVIFDGVWLYGDLGYQKGLFFSLDSYKRFLLPLHKEMCVFFKSKGLDIIFHSDGDIRDLLPAFIGLGIGAVEPLETESGLDVFALRREYKKDLALFGNIEFNKLKFSKEAFRDEVEKKIGFLKRDGGYIYRMDKDITHDITFEDYRFAMETVKKYGDYRCL